MSGPEPGSLVGRRGQVGAKPAGPPTPGPPPASPPLAGARPTATESGHRRLQHAAAHQPAQGGWHLTEWACELAGTALLMIGGLSAICLDFGTGSPVASAVPSHYWRLLITGLLFGSTGSLVTISPLGRRSGAHLNPAVTFAFWLRGHVHRHDLAGYIGSQVVGAIAGTALVRAAWGTTARSVSLGVTQPGRGLSPTQATAVEAVMTAVMVGVILAMVSSKRTARWTPLVLVPVIATLVWQGAPYTGTSLNPARSLAPAILFPELRHLWVYLVGPPLGAALAVGVFGLVPSVETLTAKLFHDPRYRSTLGTRLVAGTST